MYLAKLRRESNSPKARRRRNSTKILKKKGTRLELIRVTYVRGILEALVDEFLKKARH